MRATPLGRLPAFELFHHTRLQTLFHQRQDTAVHNALLYQLLEPGVRKGVKIALEIQIRTPGASLSQQLFDSLNRLSASAPRPKTVAVDGKVVLEYRLDHVLECRFHRPVAYRGNSQRPLLRRARLGYPDSPRRLALVALVSQFLTQLAQLGLFLRGKLLHRLTIVTLSSALSSIAFGSAWLRCR